MIAQKANLYLPENLLIRRLMLSLVNRHKICDKYVWKCLEQIAKLSGCRQSPIVHTTPTRISE